MTGITPVSDVLNEPKIPVRVTEAVPPVQATVASGSQNFTNSGEGADAQAGAGHDHAASAAEYARINARIADIFADLSAAAATPASHADAQHRVVALMPDPVVIIPLPPASADMVERAVKLAQEMAQRAAMARSAQSNVNPGMVDELLANRV